MDTTRFYYFRPSYGPYLITDRILLNKSIVISTQIVEIHAFTREMGSTMDHIRDFVAGARGYQSLWFCGDGDDSVLSITAKYKCHSNHVAPSRSVGGQGTWDMLALLSGR